MVWIECKGLERDILISVHRKTKAISEISKELNKPIQTTSKIVSRMCNHEIVTKTHEYGKDARKTEISLNKKRVRIEKSHTLYLIYYIFISIFLIFSLITSKIIENIFFFLGSVALALPILLLMAYEIYIKGNKLIVEKNPKLKAKNIGEEIPHI